jgi:catechol 2,3-dioxygenase-like lactoylglutathione lyase family enzyme
MAVGAFLFRGSDDDRETYQHGGGRGVYFDDPDGHLLELMTRPYGPG